MKILHLIVLCLIVYGCSAQSTKIPSKDWQISTAVLALPEPDRAGAQVLGYDSKGNLVTLKAGTNQYICLADDPAKKGFSVAAYHKDLEPFMARGRVLRAAGKDAGEIFDIREKEVKDGILPLPDKSTLAVASGEVNEADSITNLKIRYVVYIPFATTESTGLPLSPVAPGAPWLMNPGTHRAHIMITPE